MLSKDESLLYDDELFAIYASSRSLLPAFVTSRVHDPFSESLSDETFEFVNWRPRFPSSYMGKELGMAKSYIN
jgi:hypothetical protein